MKVPALSTMWLQRRFRNVSEFVEAGRQIGFDKFEFGHVVTPDMLQGFTGREAEVPSVHAPCPSTIGLGGRQGILLSALDEDRRGEAVRLTLRTFDLAERLRARAVIVHLGTVEIDGAIERELSRMYVNEEEDTPQFQAQRERVIELRTAHAPVYMDQVRRSVGFLLEEAGRRGLQLAAENRVHYREIPVADEMQALLAEFDALHYWHDTGHAHVLHNLGFIPHGAWLDRFKDRLLGVHLHDVFGIRDHMVCGLGEIDWRWVGGYLEPETLRTCEFDWYFEAEHLWQGVEYLEQAGCL